MNKRSKSLLFSRIIPVIIMYGVSTAAEAQLYYDHLGRDEFCIARADQDKNDSLTIRFSELKSIKDAEQLFGTDYVARGFINNLNDRTYTGLVYKNGLELYIPDGGSPDWKTIFHIRSDKYLLLIADGKNIRVGMTGNDLGAIFPRSYSQKKVITDIYGKSGKIVLSVFLSFQRGHELYIEASCIEFILGEDGLFLEEFYSYDPG